MGEKKIQPKVPGTSVSKRENTKTEAERTSQRIAQRKLQKKII